MTNIRMSKLGSDVRTCQESTEDEPRQSNDICVAMNTQHLTIDRLQADTQPQWIIRQQQVHYILLYTCANTPTAILNKIL